MRRGLHSAESIVAAAVLADTWFLCGVYFLVENDEVVYVGQSVNILSRVTSHKDKQFSRIAYILCEKDRLDWLESAYIHTLRPPLNGRYPNGHMKAPLSLAELVSQ